MQWLSLRGAYAEGADAKRQGHSINLIHNVTPQQLRLLVKVYYGR
jgi:hypothetical protein